MSDAIESYHREARGFVSHPRLHLRRRKYSPLWLLLGLGLVFLVAAAGGCVSAEAIRQCRENAAINRGHAADESLPAEAREIAEDNADAWAVQLYNLTGEEPSPATVARIESRQAAR